MPRTAKRNVTSEDTSGFVNLADCCPSGEKMVQTFFPIPILVSGRVWKMMQERASMSKDGNIGWTVMDVLASLSVSLNPELNEGRGKRLSPTLHRFMFSVQTQPIKRKDNLLAEIIQQKEGAAIKVFYPSEHGRWADRSQKVTLIR